MIERIHAQAAARPGSDRGPRGRVLEPGRGHDGTERIGAGGVRAGRLGVRRRPRPPPSTRSATRTAAASATASARSRSARPRPRRSPRARCRELTTIHRNTDAAGQLQDIRDLIAADVDAIVFNPNDPAALNPALEEAKAAGIPTISVDAYVTEPDTYNLYNNQIEYAKLGAKWLFDQLGGKGTVYYMRGLAGHPADTDRDIGFKEVLKDYPNIKVVPNADGVATGWDPGHHHQL